MARPPLKILDYLVVAICPILIGLMVGSFAYFMLECTYVGHRDMTVRWIVGCFVVATVGIARISIELGRGRAFVYGALISMEVLYAISQLAPGTRFALLVIAIAWFGIHKLTWNCTYIDEQEEDVGRGLLERAVSKAAAVQEEEMPEEATAKPSLLGRGYNRMADFLSEKEKKIHQPGIWVIYFAIVAIPIFTLAQWMIPVEQQELAVKYVTVYLFSGMGLLVATSLLGLRRYLRHRNAPMSGLTSTAWVTLGGILIVVCIGFAMLMPRPTGSVSDRLAAMRESFTFQEETTEASRNSHGRDAADENPDHLKGHGENPSAADQPGTSSEEEKAGTSGDQQSGDDKKGPTGEGSQTGKGSSKEGTSGGSSEKNQTGGSGDQEGDKGAGSGQKEDKSSGAGSGQGDDGQSGSGPQRNQHKSTRMGTSPPSSGSPPLPSGFSLANGLVLLRWLVMAAVIVIIVVGIIKYHRELVAALRELLASLRNFWDSLFGGSAVEREQRKKKRAKAKELKEPRLRFIDMVDPFNSGQAGQMRSQELIQYTFEAIETWAVDRDAARGENETPCEFLTRVEQKTRIPAESLQTLNEAYARTTYDTLPETDQTRTILINHLGIIWQGMRTGIVSNQ
ncbi:MAG: hypothetical protein PVH19_13000 [Planctomycetia bacterium]|jgi:hypothetical protein